MIRRRPGAERRFTCAEHPAADMTEQEAHQHLLLFHPSIVAAAASMQLVNRDRKGHE